MVHFDFFQIMNKIYFSFDSQIRYTKISILRWYLFELISIHFWWFEINLSQFIPQVYSPAPALVQIEWLKLGANQRLTLTSWRSIERRRNRMWIGVTLIPQSLSKNCHKYHCDRIKLRCYLFQYHYSKAKSVRLGELSAVSLV